ncbi:insecticidal delta-endotoxin Cry8Ea1 family protein [Paraburkholderia sp. DD10]|uniref:Delta endotoxin, N-terminal domain n=1 Tax=Paraburkholderia terricola TaxID=169427 RepID=A0A1M6MPP2_9BURK|nr:MULTISPECIES: insecticidal delta-endotoxin Cry8Ea1 family protein [Paraburkholderia]AXE96598.1 twin-arginine translocation pathway signal [Paraburkholderia terricola]ORC52410.1 twin-arginine translocation pathway signal [Burkholderia sp. A27]SDO06220.1 delta endotoxin, N-terminal domain [Paraburkholderia sediminicola]SHJ85340.1 delta endotoxin, N-terminal domain [Paraburkholderia terricola]
MTTRRTMIRAIPAAGIALGAPSFVLAASANPSRSDVAAPYYDPLQMFKTVLTVGLAQIPEVGWLVSAAVKLLWPSDKEDVWPQVRKQVEELVDRKIDDAVFSLLRARLNGLGGVTKLYLRAIATRDNEAIRSQFLASNTEFVAAAAEFRNPDYEWVLAPLFGMFSTMHMMLLRDCVLNGKNWGWSRATYDDIVRQSGDRLASYTKYLDQVSADEKSRYDKTAPPGPGGHQTALHDHYQPFHLKETLLVDDFRTLLTYLDPVGYPHKVPDIPFKDVYSAAYGTADDWDPVCASLSSNGVAPQYSRPLKSFSSIYIEYFNFTPRVVDVQYPTGKGPERRADGRRIDRYGIISYEKGGVEKKTITIPPPADSKRFNVAKARVTGDSIPSGVSLVLDDGSELQLWYRSSTGVKEVSVPGRMLSTLNMWTRSRFYDFDLGCIIFGFSVDTEFVPVILREIFYIGAIDQPNLGAAFLPRNVSRGLQRRREAFWRDVMSRVSA